MKRKETKIELARRLARETTPRFLEIPRQKAVTRFTAAKRTMLRLQKGPLVEERARLLRTWGEPELAAAVLAEFEAEVEETY